MSNDNTPNHNPILAAWQQLVSHRAQRSIDRERGGLMPDASKNPWLVNLPLEQWQHFLKRVGYFYTQLASLRRRNRRALQRALATSLVGAALLLALSSAPIVHAASITVAPGASGFNGSDGCSLVEAITNAKNGNQSGSTECVGGSGADTIYLPANATFNYTTAFGTNSALPDVSSTMTIEANGSTIQRTGGPNFRILYITAGGNLTLNDATISGGSSIDGGGIRNLRTLSLDNSTVSGNTASNEGGGIHNKGNATLTLNNSTVSGNSSGSAGGGIYNAGGSYGGGTGVVTLNSSTVSGNMTTFLGGGIYNGFRGIVTLNNSIVSGNSSGSGGGGGGIYNDNGTTTLHNSIVSGNSAPNGGGIATSGLSARTTLNNSTVSGNTASSDGGGIAITYLGKTTLNNSTVSGNMARDGGGIFSNYTTTLTLNNSSISGNTASRDGGGIYNGYFMTLNNSTVSGNSASDDSGGIHNDGGYYGGLYLHRSLVSGNTASDSGREISHLSGTILAGDFNLFGQSAETNAQAFSNFSPGATDITATSNGTTPTALANILNPMLLNNGGPTQTHALVTGSPALDQAPNAACTAAPINAVDQRGEARNMDLDPPSANDCDIGAYELQTPTAPTAEDEVNLSARAGKAGNVTLKWETATELQILGFNGWRKLASKNGAGKGKWKQINTEFLPAKHVGEVLGDKYRFKDNKVKSGSDKKHPKTYRYKIEVKFVDGHTEWTEIVQVKLP